MNAEATILKVPYYTRIGASFFDKLSALIIFSVLSGLFFLSDDHRFGLVFLREGIIGLSLLTVLYFLIAKKQEMDKADWYILILTALSFIMPPIFAYLHFHQPLPLGLLEERRTLLYLTYFLGILYLSNKKYSEDDFSLILKSLFYLGLLWSIANAYGIIPRNAGFSFSVHAEQFGEGFVSADARYETRFMEGGFLLSLYPYFLLARGQFKKTIIPVIFLIFYMAFINQTRGIALAIVLNFVFISFLRHRVEKNNISLALLIPTVFTLGYFAYFLYAYSIGKGVFFYDDYRNLEMNLFMREIFNNMFLPHGAVSLQFNGGFFSIYGINAYISDVGLVGLLFKYGLLVIPFAIIYVMLIMFLNKKYNNTFSIIMLALMLTKFITLPFGDFLGRGIEEFAVLMILVRLQGDTYANKYIARVRRRWTSRPSNAFDEANANA